MTTTSDPYGADARLESSARVYRYDPVLDPIADLIDQGPTAWANVHPRLLGQAEIHHGFRAAYRKAVAAGLVADDRNAQTYSEGRIA